MAKGKQNQAVKVQPRFKAPPYRPTFIKQWRKHRGLSQARLGERVELSEASISQIENGKSPYTQTHLEAIADALQCEVVDLLIRDPGDPEGIWSLWDKAKPGEREQITRMFAAMLRSSAA